MADFDKGEWKWEWEQGQPTIRKKEGLGLIATIYPKIGKRLFAPIDQAKANANFIAAAPDMYETLKELSDFLYALGDNEKLIPPEVYQRIKVKYLKGYDALAKAEGK